MSASVRYDLSGRRALVTGAASGIGLGAATALAEAGARVAINHLADDPRGPQAVASLRSRGFDVIEAPGKVGVAGETERMVETAIGELGGLDLLVNNAGTPATRTTVPAARLDLVTDDMWDQILSTNLVGVFRCSKAAAPALKQARGVDRQHGLDRGARAYRAVAFPIPRRRRPSSTSTRNLARGLAPEVRVNAIAPGAVDSTWLEWTNQQREAQVERSLLKRIGTPSDYAQVILFLAFGTEIITGETVVVDAGLTL